MPPLTDSEQQFLEYYNDVHKKGLGWTFHSATLALGYKSTGSIMRIVDSLRTKGYEIETQRSTKLQWRRKVSH